VQGKRSKEDPVRVAGGAGSAAPSAAAIRSTVAVAPSDSGEVVQKPKRRRGNSGRERPPQEFSEDDANARRRPWRLPRVLSNLRGTPFSARGFEHGAAAIIPKTMTEKKIKKKSSNNPLDLRLARIHAAKAKEDLQLGAPAPMRAGFLLHPPCADVRCFTLKLSMRTRGDPSSGATTDKNRFHSMPAPRRRKKTLNRIQNSSATLRNHHGQST
jgi:hypothetical protein